MRVSSIADQILIKASRIRNIEQIGSSKISDSIESEFIGIVNYCVMGLIQLDESLENEQFTTERLEQVYDGFIKQTYELMLQKNHDYGEIWREMLVSTFTDMILMRVNRIQQIIANKGKTIVSEGIESNLMDALNYSVFALIKLNQNKN